MKTDYQTLGKFKNEIQKTIDCYHYSGKEYQKELKELNDKYWSNLNITVDSLGNYHYPAIKEETMNNYSYLSKLILENTNFTDNNE